MSLVISIVSLIVAFTGLAFRIFPVLLALKEKRKTAKDVANALRETQSILLYLILFIGMTFGAYFWHQRELAQLTDSHQRELAQAVIRSEVEITEKAAGRAGRALASVLGTVAEGLGENGDFKMEQNDEPDQFLISMDDHFGQIVTGRTNYLMNIYNLRSDLESLTADRILDEKILLARAIQSDIIEPLEQAIHDTKRRLSTGSDPEIVLRALQNTNRAISDICKDFKERLETPRGGS